MTNDPAAYPGFITPDRSLDERPFDELHELLGVAILSGFRADVAALTADDPPFADTVARLAIDHGYEDQCSPQYYRDMHNIILQAGERIDRIVEVGVYMGGASVILAGAAAKIGAELVMIDIQAHHLQFSYQRVIRCFPELADRIRLFHGDLPMYVRDVLLPEAGAKRFIVQLDGGHSFEPVFRDLGTLYYVKDALEGVMAQDTNLRGMPAGMRFIDACLYGIFGGEMEYLAMGVEYSGALVDLMTPNKYGGNYFLPNKPEGMYLPMSHNLFEYPHPSIPIEEFFW